MKIPAFIFVFLGLLAACAGWSTAVQGAEHLPATNSQSPGKQSTFGVTVTAVPEMSWLAKEGSEDPVFAELLEEEDDETQFGFKFRLLAAYCFVLLFFFLTNQLIRRIRKTTSSWSPPHYLYLWQRTLRI